VPGVEMHRDRDVVWIVHGGQAWRNAGIMVNRAGFIGGPIQREDGTYGTTQQAFPGAA
jgi:hypothetical protein